MDKKLEAKFVLLTREGIAVMAILLIVLITAEVIRFSWDWNMAANYSVIFMEIFSIIGLIAGALTLGIMAERRRRMKFIVYPDRAEFELDWVTKVNKRLEGSAVESAKSLNTFLAGSAYGYLLVVGSGGSQLKVGPIANLEPILEQVRMISSSANSKSSTTGAKAVAESIGSATGLAGELTDLERLRNSGVITDEEFTASKKKLLGL